uniref:Uncharacterized protein n=1 Tax=Caenorhabditis japonica TaxID=281687 RepID=A0A8R1EPZ0_CAEJA
MTSVIYVTVICPLVFVKMFGVADLRIGEDNGEQQCQVGMSDLRKRVHLVREQIHENMRQKRELAGNFFSLIAACVPIRCHIQYLEAILNG